MKTWRSARRLITRVRPRFGAVPALVASVSLGLFLFQGCGDTEPSSQAMMSDEDLSSIFQRLHEPVYKVYELGLDRVRIHDHLASSFVGGLLTDQYIEHYTTLVRMGREQTSIRVVRVDYEDIRVAERVQDVVRVDADWSVGGIVTHQEHKHLRTNRYRALYDLVQTPSGWRIVRARLQDLRRVETGLGMSSDLPSSAGGLMSPLELLRAGVGEELGDGDRARGDAENQVDREETPGELEDSAN